MIEFIVFSRKGRTSSNFESLRQAGRLDVLYQCLLTAFFTSGALRRDVVLHGILGGPPRPPLHMIFDGRRLQDVRTDERTWEEILRKLLSGGSHAGVKILKESFQDVIRSRRNIYVLEERGEKISSIEFDQNPTFVLGDHIGLPRKEEKFALRFGAKVSLGDKPYLAATCIDIVNYLLDLRFKRTLVQSEP